MKKTPKSNMEMLSAHICCCTTHFSPSTKYHKLYVQLYCILFTSYIIFHSVYIYIYNGSFLTQFSSVAQSRLTLYSPMDCSMPGFPVHHHLPELAQIHVLRVVDAIQSSISSSGVPFSSCLQSFPASGSLPRVSCSHEVDKV